MFGRKLVTDGFSSSPVSGRFEAKSVEEVMAHFQSAYQINWFQNGINVYVYNAGDWGTRRFFVGADRSNEDWKELMNGAGLAYKEFNFVFNSGTQELVVSGPRDYLKLVESAFKQDRPDPSELEKHGVQLMVFPLKYASVEDRETKLREAVVKTPGVLSVLLDLLGLASKPTLGAGMVSNVKAKPQFMLGDKNQGMDEQRFKQGPNAPAPQQESNSKNKDEPALSVTADPRTNAILIRDAKSKYSYYKELIDQLDRPVAMIEVEAMMVEVDQSALNELGLEFGLISGRFNYEFPGESVRRDGLVTPRRDEFVRAGNSSIVNPSRFMARLRALAADESAKVLARPTILTQDNVSAYIDLSQTLYLQVAGERVADVVPVTAGSLLQVTPRVVHENGQDKIFIRIEIQDGSLNQDISGIGTPRVQNTSLSTQALIHQDKALLIGGYNRESTEVKDYKVPVLGSIPYIGRAFSSSEKTTQNVSRLFLITPRLIDSYDDSSSTTRKSTDKLQMDFKMNTEPNASRPSLKMDRVVKR
jgi:type III secretion protein C